MLKIAKIELKTRNDLDARISWLGSLCRLDAIDLELLSMLTRGDQPLPSVAARLGLRERTVRERLLPGAPLYDYSLARASGDWISMSGRIARFLLAP